MNGFLHQLARRARKAEPAIHSRARLPYAQLPAWPAPEDLLAPPQPVAGVADIQGNVDERRPASEIHKRDRSARDASMLQGQTRAATTPERPERKHDEPRTAGLHPYFEAGHEDGTHPTLEMDRKAGARLSDPVPTTPWNFVPLVQTVPAEARPERPRGEPGSYAMRDDSVPRKIEVQATRPKARETVARGRLPERLPATRRREGEATFDERPPDIHVSIGRVVVTATTPPLPKRTPARTRTTMPLEEYLRRRVEEGR